MLAGIFLGGKGGILVKMVLLPPELCLDDKIDFNMIKVLPLLFLKDLICPP